LLVININIRHNCGINETPKLRRQTMKNPTYEILDEALNGLQLRLEHLVRVKSENKTEIELLKQNISMIEEAVYIADMELGEGE